MMVCCDTCPFFPTCEELEPDDWGEEDPYFYPGNDDDA